MFIKILFRLHFSESVPPNSHCRDPGLLIHVKQSEQLSEKLCLELTLAGQWQCWHSSVQGSSFLLLSLCALLEECDLSWWSLGATGEELRP